MLSSWNIIYKYIGPSYVHWTQKCFTERNKVPYGGYFHGIQSKKCKSRTYLKNSVPIFKISQKLAWKFSFATETMPKKDRTIETFLPANGRHQFLDVTSFLTFSNKKRFPGACFLAFLLIFYVMLSTSISLSTYLLISTYLLAYLLSDLRTHLLSCFLHQ